MGFKNYLTFIRDLIIYLSVIILYYNMLSNNKMYNKERFFGYKLKYFSTIL